MQLTTQHLSFFDGIETKQAVFSNKKFPVHFHDTYSIGIIAEGTEVLCFNEKKIITPRKSIQLVNAYEAHSNQSYNADDIHYKTIYLNQDVFSFIAKENNAKLPKKAITFRQQPLQNSFLYHLIDGFHEDNTTKNELQIKQIALLLLENYLLEDKNTQEFSAQNDLLAVATIDFLKTHLFEKINIENWAKTLHLTPFKLIRLFKHYTGLTPIAYQILHRIEAAKKRIQQNQPLTDIAYATGFYDQSHFIHAFKHYVGVTPSAYKAGLTTH